MTTVTVWGQGAWMVGRPSVAAVLDRSQAPSAEENPDISAYPSRLMRATSLITRMSANVAAQAIASSGVDPSTIQSVYGSAFGEVMIAIEQLQMMVSGDGRISPLTFSNSVHNTAAGVFSVARQNHAMSTSLAAGNSRSATRCSRRRRCSTRAPRTCSSWSGTRRCPSRSTR